MRSAWAGLLYCLATAVMAVGCNASPSNQDDVAVLLAGDPAEIEAYRGLVSAFEATRPDFRVRLVAAADREDLLTRLGSGIAAGAPPDLFLLNYRFFAQYAARGALEPLGKRLALSRALTEVSFFPEAIDAFRYEGVITCLPQNVSSLVVYYNRDLFREAGLPDPPDSWSWDEMVQAAAALTRDLDGDGAADRHGIGVEPVLARLAPFVWSSGGEIVDNVESPSSLALRSPQAQEALIRFLALGGGGEEAEGGGFALIPSDEQVESEGLESRFLNGRLAMYMSSRRSTPTFRTIDSFDWDVAPIPYIHEQAGVLHSDGYCLTRASAAKERAWEFLEFALGPEGQRITAASGRTVPSLREVARSEAFLDPASRPSRSQVFLDGIPTLRAFPVVAGWPEIEDAADVVLEQGMYAGLPWPEVVDVLEDRTRPIFERDDG